MKQTPATKVNSLPECLTEIEKAQNNAKSPLWFRGVGSKDHSLTPSLYRHSTINKPDQLLSLEAQLMVRFRQRGVPYFGRELKDDWEALFFMQHYGIPTRLLDWSENSIVALYFSLMSAPYQKNANGQRRYSSDAVLWILHPDRWNQHALSYVSYKGGALVPGDSFLTPYAPNGSFTQMNDHPVAIYGTHNSARIVAQQGVFTIFGASTQPMEEAWVKLGCPDGVLHRIVIPSSKIATVRNALLGHGITESTIYPDLEGLARDIKRHFGFGE
jgi:hypothetical protein